MYNKVILMGRITHDLELRTTPSGANVCTFSIAVDRRFQNKGEEKKSDFFNIVAWRQQADFVCRYFGKGRMILVEGELQTRSYTDKNGANVRVTEIIADRLTFTGEKTQGGAYSDSYGGSYSAPTPSAAPQYSAPAPAPAAPVNEFSAAESDDDYPF
ncbi:MAG: single-stranded DNA-binding protein [Oscillospiraceae bacterium]|nr:single-stranded DNA-binding protein [Oscillospiraceae bacterium]